MPASRQNRADETRAGSPVRQPGWVVLLLILAVACLMAGGVLLGMMQAPVFPRKLVAVAWACVAVGVVLVPIAWAGRRRQARVDREFKD